MSGRDLFARFAWWTFRRTEKQPKHKVFGRHIPGISRTQTSGGWPLSVVLDTEWPGCPGIWVGMSRIWENFLQENFGLIFRSLHLAGTSNGAVWKGVSLAKADLNCPPTRRRDSK